MGPVFVRDFTYVEVPFTHVATALAGAGSLDQQAHAAVEAADRFLAIIGPLGSAPGLSKAVVVTVGQPHEQGDGLAVPIVWTATGPRALFPSLEGDLELAPAGPQRTQLTLLGTYTPPGGELGRLLDRYVLHRVAEATIRSFLTELARSLEPQPAPSAELRPKAAPA